MTSNPLLLSALLTAALLCQAPAASAAVQYKIVTASERGTYIKIGRDLAQFVAPAADIQLEAVPSAGSADNVRRLSRGSSWRWCSPMSTSRFWTLRRPATPRPQR